MVTIDALTIADEGAAWSRLGFTLERDGSCRIGDVVLRFAGRDAGRGLVGWSLRELACTDLDGLPTTASNAPAPSGPPPTHPNGVSEIDHVVAVSPHLDRTVAALQAAGLDLRRIREQPTPVGAPRQAFFRLGAEILEVIQEPEGVVARDGGVARPAIFWGIALRVADLDAIVATLGDGASEAREAVQPGRRIASLRRSAGLGLPVALMTP
ncbi:MAG TPA: hypothetical protein VGM91_00545 [Conexibacter sp.]|jgi:hypothetical protein